MLNNEFEKSWENLTLSNDFLFGAVMSNAKLCQKMLQRLLNIKITKIEYPEPQKAIDLAIDAKGVRLDIYVEDETETIYNVEIQTRMTKKSILPKRSRYYQGMIDLNHINKCDNYDQLKKSFVIFICTFDPFGKGLYRYTFQTKCQEDQTLLLQDEAYKLFFNTKGVKENVSNEVKAFLKYLDGEKNEDVFVKELEQEVTIIKKNEKWRRDYMTLFMRDRENWEEGKLEGRLEGKLEGKLEAAVIMIESGMELPFVAQKLELDQEVIETYLKNRKNQ